MCEINPKRSAKFIVEFWTSHEMTDQEWQDAVYPPLLNFEMRRNELGNIRVHVHEQDAEVKLEDRPPDVQIMINEIMEADKALAVDDTDVAQSVLNAVKLGYYSEMTDDEVRRDWAEWKKGS